jgi:RNA polymerase sigma-70 factor (ECF subfamily)
MQAATANWATTAMARTSELTNFDAVVAEYWPRIYRFALVSLREKGAAESLAQDCFLRAWKYRDQFRGDAAVSTWLMQIALNLIRDRIRNRRLQFWRRREELAAVWNASASLPERQRTVFLLRFVEDMDLLEIAAAMGLSEGTVKVHLFRALNSVREKVAK